MRASSLAGIVLIFILVVAGLYAAGYIGGSTAPEQQPSPHAIDQSP